ncbi:MAG: HD domain-containing protein [Anaerolineales bacterium]|jgi:putative nucleotidyltransferase with HDIG domain|nr:HD domain-containing protein [Anaerolineales bacterium]
MTYRARQFWNALQARPDLQGMEEVRQFLPAPLMTLFLRMQPGEQAHSLQIFQALREQGTSHPDLLTAALLHDVGKIRYPLQPWERALIVICKKIFPQQVTSWGSGDPSGWRRPFVVAEQHPAWGAALAAEAGAPTQVIKLIARHQQKLIREPRQATLLEDQLLSQLQVLDDQF